MAVCSLAWAEALAKVESVDLSGEIMRVGGFLLVFFIITLIIVRISKRWNLLYSGKGENPVQVAGGCNFSPGTGIRLVRIGTQAWLIGVTREHISLLAEVEDKK